MSGQPYMNPLDPAKFRQQYLANLALQASIDDANLQANKVYKRTGAPTQPTDTRTTAEKQADLYRLRIDVRSKLGEIADGANADKIVQQLDDAQLRFLADQIQYIVNDLQSKYRTGVLAEVFMPYFMKYMSNYQKTKGVNNALQQETGDQIILNQDIILSNMANKTDLDNIARVVRELGIENTTVGRNILVNIQDLVRVVSIIPTAMEELGAEDNAITQNAIQTTMNDLVKDLPTKQELNDLVVQLAQAQQRSNLSGLEMILSRLQELTNAGGDMRGEILVLQQLLAQSKAERPPLPPTPQTEAQAQSIEGIPFYTDAEGNEYMYLNPNIGHPVSKLRAYIKVLRREIGIPNLDSGGKSASEIAKTKPNMLAYLQANDDIIREVISRRIQGQTIQQAEAIPMTPSPMTPIRQPSFITPTKSSRTEGFGEEMGAETEGSGIRMRSRKIGRGLVRPPHMPNKRNDVLVPVYDVDYTQGIKPTPRFVPFGRFVINKSKLERDIIAVKRPAGSTLPELPSKRVSRNLGKIIRTMAGGNIPSYDDISKLDKEEQTYLHLLASKSHLLDKVNLPTPKKDEDEEDINQFEIMRGQIIAGNDSAELIKKFKQLILRMSNKDLIPKRQVKELMITLAENGY